MNTSSSLFLGVEYIESETTANNSSSSSNWFSNGYPISIGYQYNLNKFNGNLYPYISTNLSFYISTEQITQKNQTDITESYERTENGFGLDGNIGLVCKLSTKIDIISELKLRYANASIFTEESKYASIEFSGIYFYIGLNYNLC